MDGERFARLQEEQAKALRVSREQIERWEQFHKDYESVQQLLQSLPRKLTHDVMWAWLGGGSLFSSDIFWMVANHHFQLPAVPFGRFAFMPGQIYHTNEILVLLGDNWFAECSAHHASGVAQRRAEYVKTMLENERKQYGDLEARLHFTEEFRTTAEEHAETKEIREELSPEEQEQYSRPKRRIQWKGKAPPPQRVTPWSAAEGGVVEGGGADLWARLDELEREEELFLKKEEEEEEGARGRAEWGGPGAGEERSAGVAGRLPPEQLPSGELCGGDEGRQDGGSAPRIQPARITFTHSYSAGERGEEEEEEEEEEKSQPSPSPPLFVCPADIAHQAPPTLPDSPPAAIRSVTWDPDLKPESMVVPHPPATPTPAQWVPHPSATPTGRQPAVAFSGHVVERRGAHEQPSVEESSQRVSRFKASRRNK